MPLGAFREIPGKQGRHDRWVFLGPSDSDELALYQKYPPYVSRENTDLSMVPYRATIARAMLNVLPKEGDTKPSPAEFRPLQAVPAEDSRCKVPVLPLNNGDDVLCAELLRAIQTAGSLPPHPQTIHVTVFAEWDSLYGRALAETFAALAARGLSTPLEDPAFYPALLEALEKGLLVHHPPVGAPTAGTKIQVTVIPYLRGLDGASSLYRTNYGQTSEIGASKNQQDQNSESHPATLVEAAEGTTQFDYIRRLTNDSFTHNVPFWPQADRPDAVVIFGTDIYDKLVLLEFLLPSKCNRLPSTSSATSLVPSSAQRMLSRKKNRSSGAGSSSRCVSWIVGFPIQGLWWSASFPF